MRIRIVLDLENKKISVKYRNLLQGLIYSILSYDENYKDVHDIGYVLENKKFKMFTFSEIYGKTKYCKESNTLMFETSGCFDFTSVDEKMINLLVNYIENNGSVLLGNQIIKVLSYSLLDDYADAKQKEEYYTVSPVIIYKTRFSDGKKYYDYLSTDDVEFKKSIIENLSKKYFLIYNENMPDIQIDSIDNVKEKIVYYKKLLFKCYHFSIVFSNLNEKVKKVILETGIGNKNSSGFGMVSRKVFNEK